MIQVYKITKKSNTMTIFIENNLLFGFKTSFYDWCKSKMKKGTRGDHMYIQSLSGMYIPAGVTSICISGYLEGDFLYDKNITLEQIKSTIHKSVKQDL